MKRLTIILGIGIMIFSSAVAQVDKEAQTFSNMENAVGYLVDSSGNKYIIIESEDGAKLVKVRENPKTFFGNNFGISKEEINIKEK
jgi:hypothetical protein